MKPLRYMASMIPSPMIPCMAPAIALAYRRALLRRMPAAAAVIAPPTLPSSGCCCALPLTSPSPPISDDAPFRWALASPPELEPLTALPPPLLRMLLLLPYRLPNSSAPLAMAAAGTMAAAVAKEESGPGSEGVLLLTTSQPEALPPLINLVHGSSLLPAADTAEPACPGVGSEWLGATHGEDIGKSEGESIALRSMSECGVSSPERSQAVAAASSTSIVKGERGAWGAAAHGSETADPAWG